MKKIENYPEARSSMEAYRSIGYSFPTAVADVMDNSIFAESKTISLFFDWDTTNQYFMIKDDGVGMDRDKLIKAMQYGSQSPSFKRDLKDLGRFGLGMKTASLSQCRRLTVISKAKGEINAMRWDLDVVIAENNWVMLELDEKDIKELNYKPINDLIEEKQGTIVLWEKLDKLINSSYNMESIFNEKIEIMERHISLVFHRYINGDAEKVRVTLNGREIDMIDPFLKSNVATQHKPMQIFKIENQSIQVRPYIIPFSTKMTAEERKMLGGTEKLKSNQGYYIYRNKRLIIWGKWFDQYPKKELQKLIRVQVDIPNSLDYIWNIDIKKSQAVLPQEIKKNLGNMINKVIRDGKHIFEFRGRTTKKNEKIEYLWNRIDNRGTITYSLNSKHPLVHAVFESIEDKKLFKRFLEIAAKSIPYNQIYVDMASSNAIEGTGDKKMFLSANEIEDLLGEKIRKILDNKIAYESFEISTEIKHSLRGDSRNE